MANDFSAFVPELWAPGLLREFDKVTVAATVCANTDHNETVRQKGDTVHVQTVTKPTVRSYGETDIVYEDLSPTDETLVIDQSDYIAFRVEDIAQTQSNHGIRATYEREGGQAFAEYFDRWLFGFYSSAHADNQITNSSSAININSSTAGSAHVYDLVVQAGLKLDTQDVSQDRRWMIVTPYMKSLFLKDTVYFTNSNTLSDAVISTAMITVLDSDGVPTRRNPTGAEAAMRGFIGQISNFDIYCSNQLPSDGSGNYYCLYGQGRPISHVAQIPAGGFEAGRLESRFGWGVRAMVLFGTKVFAQHSKQLGSIYVDNS